MTSLRIIIGLIICLRLLVGLLRLCCRNLLLLFLPRYDHDEPLNSHIELCPLLAVGQGLLSHALGSEADPDCSYSAVPLLESVTLPGDLGEWFLCWDDHLLPCTSSGNATLIRSLHHSSQRASCALKSPTASAAVVLVLVEEADANWPRIQDSRHVVEQGIKLVGS